MLLQFSVENFRSIRERSEISFVAAPLKELRDSLIPSKYAKYGVIPVLALYGSNASGKSNLLLALKFMRHVILNSFVKGEKDSGMDHDPFCLDEHYATAPSAFSLDFVLSDVRYQYGFKTTNERVVEEWLFAFPKRLKQVLYTRNVEAEEEYYFSRTLEGSNKQIQTITRPNTLFISAAAKSGHALLSEISAYFRQHITIKLTSSFERDNDLAKQLSADTELLQGAMKYLMNADTGIADVQLHKHEFPESERTELEELFKVLAKVAPSAKMQAPKDHTTIKLGHHTKDGKVKYLDFSNESLGTRYLFSLLPAMLKALRHGHVLVLDEITTSLHTTLSRNLVSIFEDRQTNPLGAQLIFSTHDTNLLAPGVLRRDEIWFTEKSSEGATAVYPLTEFKTKNTDNIERGYVLGRFGAVPLLRSPIHREIAD